MSIERFRPEKPALSAHERELLLILIEVCNETIARASRTLRHGKGSTLGQPLSNKERLAFQLGEIVCMTDMLNRAQMIRPQDVETGRRRKVDYLQRDLQTELHQTG